MGAISVAAVRRCPSPPSPLFFRSRSGEKPPCSTSARQRKERPATILTAHSRGEIVTRHAALINAQRSRQGKLNIFGTLRCHLDALTADARRMPWTWTWTWTWTLTISRIDSFAHLGQHGDDPHQKSLAGFPLALVAQGESSFPAGRLRQCGPTTPETRSRAVDVQLLVSKHTASSLRQRPRSRRRLRPRLCPSASSTG